MVLGFMMDALLGAITACPPRAPKRPGMPHTTAEELLRSWRRGPAAYRQTTGGWGLPPC